MLGEQRAQLVFTDPPYNVPISGHVGGLGAVQHREFAMASGEMSPAEFTAFLQTVFGHLAAYSVDGSIHFQCMDWRHLQEMLAAGSAAYTDLKNLCVWAKNNGGMGSLYRSQHELVFVFKSGTAPHINNVELGKHGRYRTNVWSYAGVNSFGGDRDDLSLHPTVKPVAMVADAIRDCSHRKAIVLDAFAGSGTTLIAAEKTGRRGYGIEIDPAYCDVTIRRLHAVCGLDAVLDATGQPFAEVEALRGRRPPLPSWKPREDRGPGLTKFRSPVQPHELTKPDGPAMFVAKRITDFRRTSHHVRKAPSAASCTNAGRRLLRRACCLLDHAVEAAPMSALGIVFSIFLLPAASTSAKIGSATAKSRWPAGVACPFCPQQTDMLVNGSLAPEAANRNWMLWMSAFHPNSDIAHLRSHVSFVPISEVATLIR